MIFGQTIVWKGLVALVVLCGAGLVPAAVAQADRQAAPGSRNVTLVGRLPQGPDFSGGSIEVEQDPARPYVYVAQRHDPGIATVGVADPASPEVLHRWRWPDPGATARDVAHFKHEGRTYVVVALQQEAEANPAAVVLDVTDLPDSSSVKEVAHLQGAEVTGGLRRLFAYRHSDGRALLFATGGGDALVYDLGALVAGRGKATPIARVSTPEQLQKRWNGFEDVFAGYHPDTAQDRFYGAGAGGYYVFEVTDLSEPVLLASVSSAAVRRGQAVVPTPDGRYLVTAAEYRASPLRIFDLQPIFDGALDMVRTEIGAWTADWRGYAPRFEVRWPYVFVAASEDGFQMFNMRDPEAPYTSAYYHTGTKAVRPPSDTAPRGAWDLDVRNADGLIVVSDLETGLWLLTVEAFEGWNGRGWGVPDVSSAQDWDAGPVGSP